MFVTCAFLCVAGEQRPAGTFRADANIVLINATILDRHERPVRGLDGENFRLLEDKTEQTIKYFGEEDFPLSLAIVFDTSGSMAGKAAGVRRALSAILAMPGPDDEFCLITFSERPELAAPWTFDVAEIQNRVLFGKPHGRTALLDAIYLGLTQTRRGESAEGGCDSLGWRRQQ